MHLLPWRRSVISTAYAAGFFDGEGCVTIAKSKEGRTFVFLTVSNRNREVLRMMQNRWGGSLHYYPHRDKPNRAPEYRWIICARMAQRFLKDIAPFIIVKTRQLQIAKEFFVLRGKNPHGRIRSAKVVTQEYALKDRMHAVNKKGKKAS